MPFWNLRVIMDELESQMATTEFLSASPELQQGFVTFWNRCRQILMQASERRSQGMQQAQVQSAVAQATQQAAAKAAAEAVDMALDQVQAAQQVAPQAPQELMQAFAQQQQGPRGPQ
jgi:regulator of protease activity HflC (stomatin/prohibitin superfamily)